MVSDCDSDIFESGRRLGLPVPVHIGPARGPDGPGQAKAQPRPVSPEPAAPGAVPATRMAKTVEKYDPKCVTLT